MADAAPRNALPACPRCGSTGKGKVSRHGTKASRRRYKCRPCGRTFSETTGTPLYRLRHDADTVLVAAYEVLVAGASKNEVAFYQGVDWSTVRRWVRRMEEDPEAWQVHKKELDELTQVRDEVRALLERSVARGLVSAEAAEKVFHTIHKDPDSAGNLLLRLHLLEGVLTTKMPNDSATEDSDPGNGT